MLVYRICTQDELSILLNERSLDNVAMYCEIDDRVNTHKYKKDKKYIHFFSEYGDVFYYDSKERRFICTYDISEDILENSKGIGYYLDRYLLRYIQKVPEYAVESDLVSFDDLKLVEEMTDNIFYEDYVDDEYRDKIQMVYQADSKSLKKVIINSR